MEVLGTRPRLGSGRDSSRPRKPLVFSNLCYLLFTERLEQAKCGTKTKIRFWVSMRNRNPDLCISRTNCQLLHNCTTQLRSQGLHSSSLLPRGNPTVRYRELWWATQGSLFRASNCPVHNRVLCSSAWEKWSAESEEVDLDSSWVTQIFPMLHNHDMTAEQISLFHDWPLSFWMAVGITLDLVSHHSIEKRSQ